MIAKSNGMDKGVAGAILGMLLVSLLVATPYQLWLKRRAPAATRAQPHGAA
jgi:hypothetical protein